MSKLNLSKIISPVDSELAAFNKQFSSSMKSKVGLVDLLARYLIRQKGKQIRPVLVLLAAKTTGLVSERTYRGAILVELLHTATLIHDDVVDNADKRRGFWSINAVFKNKAAVLMGDYLLARGLNAAVDGNDYDFLHTITNTVRRMAEGELLQIQKTRKLNIDEQTYYQVISDKTASLLETCCKIGAMSATENEELINCFASYGANLGMAFQIKDDILDYEGVSSVIGKPVGGDIREKKITLPLIYALDEVETSKVKDIKKQLKNISKKDNVSEIINFVKENKGLEKAGKRAEFYAASAKKSIDVFPESESKQSLLTLVDFVLNRSK